MFKKLILCFLIGIAFVFAGCDDSSDTGDITLTVNVNYTGSTTINSDCKIWVVLFDNSNAETEGSCFEWKSIETATGSVVFTKPDGETIETVYCGVMVDKDNSVTTTDCTPTSGDLVWFFDGALSSSMGPIDISSSEEIDADFNDDSAHVVE